MDSEFMILSKYRKLEYIPKKSKVIHTQQLICNIQKAKIRYFILQEIDNIAIKRIHIEVCVLKKWIKLLK